MRICYVGWADYPHVQRVAKWFAQRGHEVHILSNRNASLEGVKVHNITPFVDRRPRWQRYKELGFNVSALRPLRDLVSVRRLVREIKPDILHSLSLYYPACLAAFTGFQPYVISLWSVDDYLPTKAKYSPVRPAWFYQSIFRLAVRRAKLVTGNTAFLVNQIKSSDATEVKRAVFNWGVDFNLFNCQSSREEAKRGLGLEGMPLVISPRNIGPNENVANLIKAVPQVLKEAPNTVFIFFYNYARPEILTSMRKRIDSLQLQDNIQILGQVPYEHVPQYFRAADVMVSIPFWDGGPLTLQEAMACGTLPICSNLPGAREWITHGMNGLLVDPTDIKGIAQAIIRGIGDKELRATSEMVNWELVNAKGSQERNMAAQENLYLSLLEQKTAR